MKTIPDELKSDIEDAATAGLLGNLPASRLPGLVPPQL
jgi:hypothetical protein